MGSVQAPVLTRTDLRDAFLVAGKLDKSAQFILGETLEYAPEILDVGVSLGQAYLVHRVSLQQDQYSL